MLSKQDNELLSRVGPGTPMGAFLREFWIPLLLSSEVEADGPPLRTRVLGQDLIAFRDSNSAVGFLAQNCPHRGASLFFGRNEECGLRCVYHGWKFDTTGACVDMPNEPRPESGRAWDGTAESNFKHKVRAVAYPGAERGDMIWIYMGPRAEPPPLPDVEWALVPREQRQFCWKQARECNWMQTVEGDVDTSHINYLHRRLDPNNPNQFGLAHRDGAPRLELVKTDYGLMYGARRDEGVSSYYWRTTHYMMPYFALFPASPTGIVPEHSYIPIDDDNTLVWCHQWHPYRAIRPQDMRTGSVGGYLPATSKAHGAWNTEANKSNDFLIDRARQKSENFTGIPEIQLQDTAVQVSMGRIMDRTREHLGTADAAVILARRTLLKAVKDHRDSGIVPASVDRPEMFRHRSAAVMLPPDVNWQEALQGWHSGQSDLPDEYAAAPPSMRPR